MTQIVTLQCAECGEVDVAAPKISLCICFARLDGNLNVRILGAFYALRCPGCRIYWARETDDRGVGLLRHYGATIHTIQRPAEATEPRHGSPIRLDDLIDPHFDLERELA